MQRDAGKKNVFPVYDHLLRNYNVDAACLLCSLCVDCLSLRLTVRVFVDTASYVVDAFNVDARHEKSGNEQFLTEISKWVFHERGHLKAVNVTHHRAGGKTEPAMYRINDDLEFSVEIYEWSGTSWQPYVADDVQVQFYMMSPYVLKNLSTDLKGLYFTSFKVPDVYGVFQFKVEYERLGYTALSLSKQIPVRPFRHNEYERFIPAAFPYYGASFSTMAGFFIFTIVYLYNK